ncbi:ATP-binding protein [Flavobacterium ginsengiterrae]|uniref:Schlafen AlbA-2 domain-containing protein n=1 Tax=Flavobacterium ginsengiterrae TaxID=871695 RepID=A0ABP7G9Z8_9FLAO
MSDFKFQINSRGFLINRESFDLEYKQSFHFGDSLVEYTRSMVGMANNRGGKIIFGIQDSPRKPVGLTNDKFTNVDTTKINNVVSEYFSHEFDWEITSIEFNSMEFGIIEIKESNNKPIVCKKTKQKYVREGAIYYRYRGETKEISYPELANILDKEKEKERRLWLSHIQKISDIGPQNVQFLDTYKGEISLGNEKILIDKSLLDQIKFIKEGEFVEKDGAPALTLAGEISGIFDNGAVLPNAVSHPYQSSDIESEFGLSRYQVMCLIRKLNIQNNPKYHDPIKTGKNSTTHKYSDALMNRVEKILERYPSYISEACAEYQKQLKANRIKK